MKNKFTLFLGVELSCALFGKGYKLREWMEEFLVVLGNNMKIRTF